MFDCVGVADARGDQLLAVAGPVVCVGGEGGAASVVSVAWRGAGAEWPVVAVAGAVASAGEAGCTRALPAFAGVATLCRSAACSVSVSPMRRAASVAGQLWTPGLGAHLHRTRHLGHPGKVWGCEPCDDARNAPVPKDTTRSCASVDHFVAQRARRSALLFSRWCVMHRSCNSTSVSRAPVRAIRRSIVWLPSRLRCAAPSPCTWSNSRS